MQDLTINDHSISFPESEVMITLQLCGIFSFFLCRIPMGIELDECDVFVMTPGGQLWDPHSDSYAWNEENMIDWDGQLVELKDCVQVLFNDIVEDTAMISDAHISSIKSTRIDNVESTSAIMGKDPDYSEMTELPPDLNEVASALTGVSSVLDPVMLASALDESGAIGHWKICNLHWIHQCAP